MIGYHDSSLEGGQKVILYGNVAVTVKVVFIAMKCFCTIII